MKRATLAFVVSVSLTFSSTPFGSDTATALRNLPTHSCTVPNIIGILELQPIKRAADIAKQQLVAIEEMRRVNDKAKDANRPLEAQVSKADIARFSEARQRMMAMQLASLIESRRERDLRVILQLVQLADKNYRWGEKLDDKDPRYILQALLDIWDFMAEGRKWETSVKAPESASCSLERALYSIQQEADAKLGKLDINRAAATLERLAKKYGKPIDRTKVPPEERGAYGSAMEEIDAARRELRFMYDLERIKVMARASETIYEADKQDITYSGGRMEALGTTISERVKANAFDEQTQFAIGMWRKINEKLPAGVLKDWEEISKRQK